MEMTIEKIQANFLILLGAIALIPAISLPGLSQLSEAAIQRVIGAGLMSEYPDGSFHGERGITRAELAAILVKTFQLQQRAIVDENAASSLVDVSSAHWAYDDIQWVVKTGIMSGYRPGYFYPDRPISRAEGFAIFTQAYGVLPLGNGEVDRILKRYTDGDLVPYWARQAIATALIEELVNLEGTQSISPLQPMTRSDMVYALDRYLEKQQNPGTIPDFPVD
jgi:hypothetical protein